MQHWRHLQHMLRYVKKHPHRGIRFSKQDNAESNTLVCYVDSSFGDGPSGRATTGYTFFMNGGCVSWRSNLQKSTSRSTMEAEVSAAAYAAEEAKFLNDLLYEMGDPMRKPIAFIHKQPIVFHEDNAACIVFCNNINVTGRNKKMGRPCNFDTAPLHKWTRCSKCKLQASGMCESAHDPTHCIDIPSAQRHTRQNYFEIRQLIADGEAIMIKCDTADMVADALTKALGPVSFVKHMEALTAHLPPIIGDKRSTLQTNQGVQSDLPDVHELLNGASTAGRSEPLTSDVRVDRGRNSPANFLEPLSKGRKEKPSPEPQGGRTVDELAALLTRKLQQAMMDQHQTNKSFSPHTTRSDKRPNKRFRY